MRPALISLVPMITAAVLVTVGGERMARREVEIRAPIDHHRLFDFDQLLRAEIERLDVLYQSHLTKLALKFSEQDMTDDEARETLRGVSGVLRVQVFIDRKAAGSYDATLGTPRLPEVVFGDAWRAFDPNLAVVLERNLDTASLPRNGLWQETPAQGVLLKLFPTPSDKLVALFIDHAKVNECDRNHLATWLESPITPLREAGERIRVSDPSGEPLITIGPSHHGPAAATLPIRNAMGTWQVDAWDSVTTHTSHDVTVLVVASSLAVLLAVSGILLHHQQRRTMKLAAERVSFVNRVSHELGTPLTNLALNLDLARDHLPDPPPAALHRLNLVSEEIQRLSRLVANVLTFSRKERDAIELHPMQCIPAEVVAGTIESFRPALERRGIQIETQIDAAKPALLDPDALAQITGNLISNVEKYAATGGWMHVAARNEGGNFILEVHDRGPGIPSSFRKRLFTPFTRVHQSVNEGSSGTGLGLAIARELALRMGGDLVLLDATEGCVFQLRLPVQNESPIPDCA